MAINYCRCPGTLLTVVVTQATLAASDEFLRAQGIDVSPIVNNLSINEGHQTRHRIADRIKRIVIRIPHVSTDYTSLGARHQRHVSARAEFARHIRSSDRGGQAGTVNPNIPRIDEVVGADLLSRRVGEIRRSNLGINERIFRVVAQPENTYVIITIGRLRRYTKLAVLRGRRQRLGVVEIIAVGIVRALNGDDTLAARSKLISRTEEGADALQLCGFPFKLIIGLNGVCSVRFIGHHTLADGKDNLLGLGD